MKDKSYFGIGSGENALYRTLDNGLTWEVVTSGGMNFGDEKNGRMIFGSTENKGLTYSDDGGITRNESNIKTGNWGHIAYSESNKFAYAASLDGNGIVVSEDDGETWEWTNVGFGNWNNSWGNVDFGSNDGGAHFDGKNGTLYGFGNAVTSNGDFSTMTIPADIVPVINKIIAPQIFFEVTGERFKSDVDALDLLVKESGRFYVSSNNYYTSNIDWENDINMKPFEIDLTSALLDEGDNLIISDIKDNDTDQMKSTIQKVRRFIEAKKNSAIAKMAERIVGCNVDTDNIMEMDESRDEILNAIEVQKAYEDVMKVSVVSVMTTAYNRIFGMDDSMIRKLIYSGIYETIIIVAGDIKRQLDAIKDRGIKEVTKNDFSVRYDFSKGLKMAFEKYLKGMSSLITVLNESDDKDLIGVAADFYESNKPDYVFQAAGMFEGIALDLDGEKSLFKEKKLSPERLVRFMYEKTLQAFNDNLKISFKYFENELEKYSLKDKETITGYLCAIYEKFKERLLEYTKFVYDKKLDIELIVKQIDGIFRNISDPEAAIKTSENFFLKIFRAEWRNNKDSI